MSTAAPRFSRCFTRAVDDGQRLQAQEVELHQAGALDPLHVELGGRQVRARIAVERRQLGQRPVADHHAGGVGRGVAVEALELQRDVQQVARPPRLRRAACCRRGSISMALASVTGLAGLAGTILARRSTWPSGSCITRPTSRSTARACRVPKVMIWATRSRPYLLLHVGDHLLAPLLAEVDVEVGHRDPLGVQEALEQQAVAQGVQVGDGQRPGDQRAGARTAPRPHRDAMRLGPLDEVRDDQEVAGEAHLDDHADLAFQTRGWRACASRPTSRRRLRAF